MEKPYINVYRVATMIAQKVHSAVGPSLQTCRNSGPGTHSCCNSATAVNLPTDRNTKF